MDWDIVHKQTHKYIHPIYDKEGTAIQWGKTSLFNQ